MPPDDRNTTETPGSHFEDVIRSMYESTPEDVEDDPEDAEDAEDPPTEGNDT